MKSNANSQAATRARQINTLRPFAEPFAKLSTMPTRRLNALIAATEILSTMNCWWVIYGVAPLVAEMARGELQNRKFLAARKREAARANAA